MHVPLLQHIRRHVAGCIPVRLSRVLPPALQAWHCHRRFRRFHAGVNLWIPRNAQSHGSAAGSPCLQPGRHPGSCPDQLRWRCSPARRLQSGRRSPGSYRSRRASAGCRHPRLRPTHRVVCRRRTARRSCVRSRAGRRLRRCPGYAHAATAALHLRRYGWWCRPGCASLPCGPVPPSAGNCVNTGSRRPARWAHSPTVRWRCCGHGAGRIHRPRRHAAGWRCG